MKDIKTIQNEIVDEFSVFDEWMDKYAYLIELGKSLNIIKDEFKTDSNLIRGCQSQVWLNAEYIDGKIIYTADSDAIITKGIISLLVRVLSNQSPDDIFVAEMDFINDIGLKEHLSPTRANGLVAMIKQMKLYALAFKTKNNG